MLVIKSGTTTLRLLAKDSLTDYLGFLNFKRIFFKPLMPQRLRDLFKGRNAYLLTNMLKIITEMSEMRKKLPQFESDPVAFKEQQISP